MKFNYKAQSFNKLLSVNSKVMKFQSFDRFNAFSHLITIQIHEKYRKKHFNFLFLKIDLLKSVKKNKTKTNKSKNSFSLPHLF